MDIDSFIDGVIIVSTIVMAAAPLFKDVQNRELPSRNLFAKMTWSGWTLLLSALIIIVFSFWKNNRVYKEKINDKIAAAVTHSQDSMRISNLEKKIESSNLSNSSSLDKIDRQTQLQQDNVIVIPAKTTGVKQRHATDNVMKKIIKSIPENYKSIDVIPYDDKESRVFAEEIRKSLLKKGFNSPVTNSSSISAGGLFDTITYEMDNGVFRIWVSPTANVK